MTRRTLVSLALVFFGVAALGVVALVVVRGISDIRQERLLQYTLTDVDELLVANRHARAAEELDAFRTGSLDGAQWISVLRRAYVVARELPEWNGFGELSGRALGQHERNSELAAVAVYARHRAGETADPVDVPAGARYDSLRGAVSLRHGGSVAVQDESVSALLSAAEDPSAAILQRAYDVSGDARFAVDAALARLAEGDAATAFDALPAEGEGISPVFRAGVALSAGRLETVRNILHAGARDQAEAELLRGDAGLGLGDFGAAWRSYTAVARDAWSAETFQSTAHLERVRGEEPVETLREGRDAHPADAELTRALALAIAEEEPEEAQRLLNDAQERSALARLSNLVLFEMPATTNRVRGTLWMLYNQSESPEIGAYLAWYLAGLRDWDDLSRLIRDGEGSWTRFYRGVMELRAGTAGAAQGAFEEIETPELAVAARYNEGRISLAVRDLDRAAQGFAAAQEKLERERRTRQRDKRLSRVLEGRARVHLLKGELETGYRMLSRAIEYDPGNASARNRLETGTSQR